MDFDEFFSNSTKKKEKEKPIFFWLNKKKMRGGKTRKKKMEFKKISKNYLINLFNEMHVLILDLTPQRVHPPEAKDNDLWGPQNHHLRPRGPQVHANSYPEVTAHPR